MLADVIIGSNQLHGWGVNVLLTSSQGVYHCRSPIIPLFRTHSKIFEILFSKKQHQTTQTSTWKGTLHDFTHRVYSIRHYTFIMLYIIGSQESLNRSWYFRINGHTVRRVSQGLVSTNSLAIPEKVRTARYLSLSTVTHAEFRQHDVRPLHESIFGLVVNMTQVFKIIHKRSKTTATMPDLFQT